MSRERRHQDHQLRFILIGDYEVGKTALLNALIPISHPNALTGPHFRSKTFPLSRKIITVQLWDTDQEERFNSAPNYYFQKVDAVLFVYDITRLESFNSVVNFWRGEVEEQAGMGIQMALVGNKCDRDEEREVEREDAMVFANEHGMMFMETSAVAPGQDLSELLVLLSEKLMREMEGESKLQQMNKITLKTSSMKGKNTKSSCF